MAIFLNGYQQGVWMSTFYVGGWLWCLTHFHICMNPYWRVPNPTRLFCPLNLCYVYQVNVIRFTELTQAVHKTSFTISSSNVFTKSLMNGRDMTVNWNSMWSNCHLTQLTLLNCFLIFNILCQNTVQQDRSY